MANEPTLTIEVTGWRAQRIMDINLTDPQQVAIINRMLDLWFGTEALLPHLNLKQGGEKHGNAQRGGICGFGSL